jgi:SagB-type dehydrogenase family enzyme
MNPVSLPPPATQGALSVEQAIARRRSLRRYSPQALTLAQLGQVLWACQGLTSGQKRAVPSAGATYPLEVHVVVGKGGVEGLEEGIYGYRPEGHALHLLTDGDKRAELATAALNERFLWEAPVDLVVCAIYERTTEHYGNRGERYVHFEVGHLGQNAHLQALALGLGTVMVGAFDDEQVSRVLGLEEDTRPLYIMPVGRPADFYGGHRP